MIFSMALQQPNRKCEAPLEPHLDPKVLNVSKARRWRASILPRKI